MYRLPSGMRYATLDERNIFYEDEFDLAGVRGWLRRKNTAFALIIGRHTGIYPEEFKDMRKDTIVVDSYKNLSEVREYILQYLPEGVYYDRNIYADLEKCHSCKKERKKCRWCNNLLGQELAFDIDPENVTCPYHGDLGQKMKSGQGLGFCMYEFNVVRKQTLRLYEGLSGRFSKMKVVYSGRGFHIHVFDEDATKMGFRDRKKLANELEEYAIDGWVTSGEMRLIRLPYSLHGMVSRICSPLGIEKVKYFDPRKECIPTYIRRPG